MLLGLLHLIVVLPNVCAALEAHDGEASGARYQCWCERYLADAVLSGEEWWQARCSALHQGRTRPKRGRWGAYRFHHPDSPQPHKTERPQPNDKPHLDLRIDAMAQEVWGAVYRWVDELGRDAPEARRRAKHVEQFLPTVAIMDRPAVFGQAAGFTSPVSAMSVTVHRAP